MAWSLRCERVVCVSSFFACVRKLHFWLTILHSHLQYGLVPWTVRTATG